MVGGLGMGLMWLSGCHGGLACGSEATPDAPARGSSVDNVAQQVEAESLADLAVHQQMGDHFMDSDELREALVRGDLLAAQASARDLSRRAKTAELPATWKPWLGQLAALAEEVAGAPDVATAAHTMGNLGLSCAACHEKMGAAIVFSEVPPAAGDDLESHMQRHQWAAERMWEGLLAGDDQRFATAADALTDAPLRRSPSTRQPNPPTKVDTLARDVHRLAREGKSASDSKARARIYGKFLSACADCHTELGVRENP
ncbi:MAG: hypothetical protein OXR73_31925 [Myxococcales bacterium]|nr:hypothetical protein [Myxococcales bacterium]